MGLVLHLRTLGSTLQCEKKTLVARAECNWIKMDGFSQH